MFEQEEQRRGSGIIWGVLVLISLPPVTFPEYLSKLKMCFKSMSLLFVVVGRGDL